MARRRDAAISRNARLMVSQTGVLLTPVCRRVFLIRENSTELSDFALINKETASSRRNTICLQPFALPFLCRAPSQLFREIVTNRKTKVAELAGSKKSSERMPACAANTSPVLNFSLNFEGGTRFLPRLKSRVSSRSFYEYSSLVQYKNRLNDAVCDLSSYESTTPA